MLYSLLQALSLGTINIDCILHNIDSKYLDVFGSPPFSCAATKAFAKLFCMLEVGLHTPDLWPKLYFDLLIAVLPQLPV